MIECDLTDLICPLSKMKATQFVDSLSDGQTAKIWLGDTESLKSVTRELKARQVKLAFEHNGQNRFALIVTK
ncbi:MAG: sulfurtransferase TusA family protein [Chloroflexi bacterium]|nr:sulfurtransferase TusA family protein [Chloroflexota bacterium]